MATDEAGTRFLDGMRVATEHMRHLQRSDIARAQALRGALGAWGVAHGFKVEAAADGSVTIAPGLAFDAQGRPLRLRSPARLRPEAGRRYLVARYALEASLLVGGVPTLLDDGIEITQRVQPPPYDDAAVPLAEVVSEGDRSACLQRGEWYLPPLDHGHSGAFVTDALGRWRYDGAALGATWAAHFDSGFVPLAPGDRIGLAHGLMSRELVVELIADRGGVVGNRGVGSAWWYELPDADHLVLCRARSPRARPGRWPCAPAPGAPGQWRQRCTPDRRCRRRPRGRTRRIVHAGRRRSRALGGRRLVRFRWTLMG
jgi:hypothetical protein